MKRNILSFISSIILSGIIILSFSFTPSSNSNVLYDINDVHSNEVLECKYGRCHATAKSTGKRCKHCVSKKGDYNCYQHK